jgi:transcriptional regulator with XRE-family HTH domain
MSKGIVAELSRFGANIRRERTARNVTQERLAERADLNIRTLQKIEAGELNVLITTAARIQRALACSWEKLMPAREQLTTRKGHS